MVLGLLALVAVFLLPTIVTEPWIGGDAEQSPPRQEAAPTSVAPSTAAEKTKYRQDSQALLAEIIASRDLLIAQNVDSWGQAGFQQALKAIEAGDEQYQFGEYRASLDHYQQALDGLDLLEVLGGEKLAAALAGGLDAVETLNVNEAVASSELATLIAANDAAVKILAARVAVLPEVAAQVEQGDQARNRGDLDVARTSYQQALGQDPAHRRAADSLADVETAIIEARFNQHMSRGYAALEADDYEGARSAFRDAAGVFPGHAAVSQARAQVENRQSQSRVSSKIQQAAELEAREEWQQAVLVYESLLDQDASLTQAKVKLIPARVRADLDLRLTELIDEPLKLSEPSGFRRGQAALNDARGIPAPGARLSGQIASLEDLLVLAVAVVDVEFQSDNQTHVTLFRIAELGRFEKTSVRLKPGRYIVARTRKGFRDVQVEFIVTGKPLGEPIVVRCEEPI